MGHVEYKFISEMSFPVYDSLVSFARNYCCVDFNTAGL